MHDLLSGKPANNYYEVADLINRLLYAGRDAMTRIQCPLCNGNAEGGHHIDDDTVYICKGCGGYRLKGTVEHLIRIGTISNIDLNKIRLKIIEKRGSSSEYPIITEYDF